MTDVLRNGDYYRYCWVCGKKVPASQIRIRPFDKKRVCPQDWEPYHPGLKPMPFGAESEPKEIDAFYNNPSPVTQIDWDNWTEGS